MNEIRHRLEDFAERLERARRGDAEESAATYEPATGLSDLIGELLAGTFEGSSRCDPNGPDDTRGEVTATVDGSGRLRQLEICPYAMRDMDHRELSAACMRAVRAARDGLAAALDDQLSEVSGQSTRPDLDPAATFDVAGDIAWRRWT